MTDTITAPPNGAATVHVVPSETHLSEDVKSLATDFKIFYHRNRDVFIIVGAMGLSLLLTRMMLRRELKKLHFSIEVFPDDSYGDYGLSTSINDGD